MSTLRWLARVNSTHLRWSTKYVYDRHARFVTATIAVPSLSSQVVVLLIDFENSVQTTRQHQHIHTWATAVHNELVVRQQLFHVLLARQHLPCVHAQVIESVFRTWMALEANDFRGILARRRPLLLVSAGRSRPPVPRCSGDWLSPCAANAPGRLASRRRRYFPAGCTDAYDTARVRSRLSFSRSAIGKGANWRTLLGLSLRRVYAGTCRHLSTFTTSSYAMRWLKGAQ